MATDGLDGTEIDLEEKTDVEEREGREGSGEEDWCLERAPRAAVREKKTEVHQICSIWRESDLGNVTVHG